MAKKFALFILSSISRLLRRLGPGTGPFFAGC